MNEIIQTQGLVLDKFNLGEWDSFFTILTKDFGKINFFAKSARKPKAKLASHLEPGSISNIYFVERKKREDYLLTGAILILKPDFLTFSYKKNLFFSNNLLLAKKVISEAIQSPEELKTQYKLVVNFLKLISKKNLKEIEARLYQISYVLKLLDKAGFRPNFKTCLNCGQKIQAQNTIYYDSQNGGLVCCMKRPENFSLNFNTLKLTNYLLKKPFTKIKKLNVNQSLIEGAWNLTVNHLKYCIE